MKKLIALVLALTLVASLGAAAWAVEEDAPADRADAAVALWDLAGQPVVDYAPGFDDLDANADYMDAVRWAASVGIIKGYDATTFGPNDPVTREQFAVMLYRYAQTLGLGFTGVWYFPLDYADAAEISDWADEAMHWVVMECKPEPADNMLHPQATVTLGELESAAATFADILGAASSDADVAEQIIGTWIVADRNGTPAMTNGKYVVNFVSDTKAYVSASFLEAGGEWVDFMEADVTVSGSKVTLTGHIDEQTTFVDEYTMIAINASDFTANHTYVQTANGATELTIEDVVRFAKVDVDYTTDIIGTWEGRCTSVGSVFDDGQEHRWEYNADGSYVYYIKDGDSWTASADTLNAYFVAGNLLCTRWMNEGERQVENREWWEITIGGDKMYWMGLRQDDNGSTFTATFEMTRVAE